MTTRHHSTRVKCSNCNVTTDKFGRESTDKTPKEDLAKSTQLLHPSEGYKRWWEYRAPDNGAPENRAPEYRAQENRLPENRAP